MNLFRYLKASFAALLGVQSNENRVNDFKQNSAIGYIISGVILVICFVLGLVLIVNLVLPSAN